MAHNFAVPDETQLERLISKVYAAMPGPEQTQLNRIEEWLACAITLNKSRTHVNKIPWWIVLLLAGGFATAAWWAGERWFGGTEPVSLDNQLQPSEKEKMMGHTLDKPGMKSDADGPPEKQMPEDNKSSVIYQRENF